MISIEPTRGLMAFVDNDDITTGQLSCQHRE